MVEALLSAKTDAEHVVDATFGGGGHSRALLRHLPSTSKVFAFDVDASAMAEARRTAASDPRLVPRHAAFGSLDQVLPPGLALRGLLADLGVSSMQLDRKHRGFSPMEDGPLDLRMNSEIGLSASQWLDAVSPEELAWVLREYGEDRDPLLAARLAEAICARRPLRRTTELAEVVAHVKAKTLGKNPFEQPARLTFQAIRSHLNQEFSQLCALLAATVQRLATGGRAVIICFKAKEVSTVRQWLRQHEEPSPDIAAGWPEERLLSLYPLLQRSCEEQPWCITEALRPLKPEPTEVQADRKSVV